MTKKNAQVTLHTLLIDIMCSLACVWKDSFVCGNGSYRFPIKQGAWCLLAAVCSCACKDKCINTYKHGEFLKTWDKPFLLPNLRAHILASHNWPPPLSLSTWLMGHERGEVWLSWQSAEINDMRLWGIMAILTGHTNSCEHADMFQTQWVSKHFIFPSGF